MILNEPVSVRVAHESDMATLQPIYAYHVLNGLGSFEETPPDIGEFTRRFTELKARNMPYLVGERAGRILGYAYAGPYRPRPAYRYSVEDSIYIAREAIGQGIGRILLAALIRSATDMGYRQMIAVIGDSDNRASIELHRALGFTDAGKLRSVGFKFGRWVDSVLMQRALGAGESRPPT